MASQLRLRRGTTAQHSTFTGASGEVTVDTTKKTLVVHDGTTPGGNPLLPAATGAVATANLADAAVTAVKIADANVTTPKIADANVTTAKIADANVTSAKLAAGAAAANLGFTPANSAATVNLTGDQTIGGVKTFTSGVRFNDGTTQTTAASTPTTLYAVGTYVIGRPNSTGGSTFAVNSTIAGSSLYAVSAGAVTSGTGGGVSTPGEGYGITGGSTLVNTGSWRCVSPAGTGPYDGPAGGAGYAGLYVRFA